MAELAAAAPGFDRVIDGFRVSTDRALLDREAIFRFLHHDAYWCKGIPRERVERALDHSLCFGAYAADGAQAGFARVVTDHASFGYVADVFVLPAWRGRGLSKQLMAAIQAHPDLQGFRRWLLATRDAHGLYAQFGFKPLIRPEWSMERFDPTVYGTPL
ncbi:MAG: GNAT family N-acetyltransferase [Alphaproteobacteria bacterium]|nr:GNAT family N-acetyltransferase [Alphaproteobacteria bacterium]